MAVTEVKDTEAAASLEEKAARYVEALLRERAGCVRRVEDHESSADELKVGGDDVGALSHTRISQRFRKRIHEIEAEIVHYGGEVPDDEYAKPAAAAKKAPAKKKPAADGTGDDAGDAGDGGED